MTLPCIIVQTASAGPREIPVKWAGDWLAVHRPVRKKGLSSTACLWSITLKPLGLCASEVSAPLRSVLRLAKLWDSSAADWGFVEINKKAHCWKWKKRFKDDVCRVESGRDPLGPRELSPIERLDSAGTVAEVKAAVAAAMGSPELSAAEQAEPFPVSDVLPADRVKSQDGWLSVRWRGQWWPVPSTGEIETMISDSACDTPDGRQVEPDHPESWLSILALC